jgi:hypothetical protein
MRTVLSSSVRKPDTAAGRIEAPIFEMIKDLKTDFSPAPASSGFLVRIPSRCHSVTR